MNTVLLWTPAALFAVALVLFLVRCRAWALGASTAATVAAIARDSIEHDWTNLCIDAGLVALLAATFIVALRAKAQER